MTVVLAASGIVLSAGLPAHAAPITDREVTVQTLSTVAADVSVSAADDAKVSFDRAAVKASTAVEEVPVAVQSEAVVEVAVEAPAVQAPAVEPVEVEAPAAPESSSGIGATLVASAYSQIGIMQDCTAMVETALRAAGKTVGDLGPEQFYQFGDVVGTPEPGDLVIRPGHVAIYVGNGQVISGGFNGMNTQLHSLSDLSGSSFVRVR